MTIGPLEYVVIAVRGDRFTEEVLPALVALQTQGAVRVVDLLFIDKADDGTVVLHEVDQLAEGSPSTYDDLADGLGGLLTHEDIDRLAEQIPSGMSAVVVLFEHAWTSALRAAVDRAGGAVLGGGLADPDILMRLEEELAGQASAQ
ncbi:MAG: DUF6325 family protein [Ktedonobacterales bacterium]